MVLDFKSGSISRVVSQAHEAARWFPGISVSQAHEAARWFLQVSPYHKLMKPLGGFVFARQKHPFRTSTRRVPFPSEPREHDRPAFDHHRNDDFLSLFSAPATALPVWDALPEQARQIPYFSHVEGPLEFVRGEDFKRVFLEKLVGSDGGGPAGTRTGTRLSLRDVGLRIGREMAEEAPGAGGAAAGRAIGPWYAVTK